MMSSTLAAMAHVPTQVAEWADWSTYESTGRRAIKKRRRNRIRHPRLWNWSRIAMVTTPWSLPVALYWATGPVS